MLRHQTIESLTSHHVDMTVERAIVLLDQVATQIILLVGQAGFESLYARSLYVIHSQFPWLDIDNPIAQADHRFVNLQASLQAQPLWIAIEANRVLLVTLTDILASLIGEPLTTSIMDLAWGSNALMKSGKEPKK